MTKYRDEKQISACQGLGMVKGKRVAVTIKRQHKRFFFLVIIYFCIRITMELHELHTGLSGIELFLKMIYYLNTCIYIILRSKLFSFYILKILLRSLLFSSG